MRPPSGKEGDEMKRVWMIVSAVLVMGSGAARAEDKAAPKKEDKAAGAPQGPTMTPEGKRWVESLLGKWTDKATTLQMGENRITGKMTMACEKTSGGWGANCKGRFEAKGMPAQEISMLLGWDLAEATAHMFEVANTGEVHDHSGKWTDDKTISLVRNGKNIQGKEEVDTVTFAWASPKALKVSGEGKQDGAVAWSFSSDMKK
jgi:hypothetical protein